jgi:hypothetical protein
MADEVKKEIELGIDHVFAGIFVTIATVLPKTVQLI